MNCPQCGHPAENHHTGSLGMGCYFEIEGQTYAHDDCRMSPVKIELHHWKAEALAARKVLEEMKGRITFRHAHVEEETNRLYQEYLAAKVEEMMK